LKRDFGPLGRSRIGMAALLLLIQTAQITEVYSDDLRPTLSTIYEMQKFQIGLRICDFGIGCILSFIFLWTGPAKAWNVKSVFLRLLFTAILAAMAYASTLVGSFGSLRWMVQSTFLFIFTAIRTYREYRSQKGISFINIILMRDILSYIFSPF
jgi:hypothetical protein